MNRLEKIDLLRRIKTGEASILDLDSIVAIFCDNRLPEAERKYYILKDNNPVEISIEAINKLTTQKVFFDINMMYV